MPRDCAEIHRHFCPLGSNPLTRLAPADESAGGSPPSPPRGRGRGIYTRPSLSNVQYTPSQM
jgi:hypothetical protein